MYFKTLSQFYSSSEWRKFRKNVIVDRINKEDSNFILEAVNLLDVSREPLNLVKVDKLEFK